MNHLPSTQLPNDSKSVGNLTCHQTCWSPDDRPGGPLWSLRAAPPSFPNGSFHSPHEADPPQIFDFYSVQSLSRVQFFVTPWTAARQASLSITNSQSLLKLMSIELVMPSNHLILCPPLLLLPSIFSSIRVFSNESALHIRWPKYCSFSFSISPFNEYPFTLGWTGWIFLQSKGLSRVFFNTTVQKHQFFGAQLSL